MKRDAFTLLEIILAVAILATLSVTIAIVLGIGVDTWHTATTFSDRGHEADGVVEQVSMALRSAYYPANGEPSYDYGFQHEDGGTGEHALDSISWVKIGDALIGEDTPWSGAAHRVRLFVEDGNSLDGPGLYVAAWQLVGQPEDFDPEKDVKPVLLSDRVVALDCRMQDPEAAHEAGEPWEWIDEWENTNRIPNRILLTMAIRGVDEKSEPDVFVRQLEIPMADTSWNPSEPGGGRSRGDFRHREPGEAPAGEGGDGGTPRIHRQPVQVRMGGSP